MTEPKEDKVGAGITAFRRLRKICLLAEDKLNEKAFVKLLKSYASLCGDGLLNLDTPYELKTHKCFIHAAAIHGCQKLLFLLLELGADVDKQDGDGNTAFYYVVSKMDSDVTRSCLTKLVEHGCRMDVRNNKGQIPFDIASYRLEKFLRELEKICNPKRIPEYNFSLEDLKNTFKLLDQSSNGFFNLQTLRQLVSTPEVNQGHEWNDDLVHTMFKLVDQSGEGNIDQKEFVTYFTKHVNGFPVLPPLPTASILRAIYNRHIDLVWVPQTRSSKMASVADIARLVKKADLNFVTLDKVYTMNFLNESGHTYTSFMNFAKAFDPGKDKRLQKTYYRVFNTFCEANEKICNGRLLVICLAGVLPQVLANDEFSDMASLNKQRAEFTFKLLDINGDGWLSNEMLMMFLKVVSLFIKKDEEIEKELELLIIASGSRKFKDQFPKESFMDVCQRFPESIFPTVPENYLEAEKKKKRKRKKKVRQ